MGESGGRMFCLAAFRVILLSRSLAVECLVCVQQFPTLLVYAAKALRCYCMQACLAAYDFPRIMPRALVTTIESK